MPPEPHESRSPKAEKIARTMADNKERREGRDKACVELKVRKNKLSTAKRLALEAVFREAKWVRNHVVGLPDPFSVSTVGAVVPVKRFNPVTQKCDIDAVAALTVLGSQMKQSVVRQVQQDIVNLGKRKKKGGRVGRLKFVREVNQIPLKQHGITYLVTPKGVRIQNIGWLKVGGLDQIFDKCGKPIGEIASARLVRRPSGWYLKVLMYAQKDLAAEAKRAGEIAPDFGVKDPIVLSDRTKPDVSVPYPKELRQAHRAVSRCQPGSGRRGKARRGLQRQAEKYTRQKGDKANKFIHLLKQYSHVGVQDDHIAAWRQVWGRKLGEADLGSIKRRVINLRTSTVVGRFVATTQGCPLCHKNNPTPLSEREYTCSCGFREDRDVKSARLTLALSIYQKEHPLEGLRGLSAEALAAVRSIYERISRACDAESAQFSRLGDAPDLGPG